MNNSGRIHAFTDPVHQLTQTVANLDMHNQARPNHLSYRNNKSKQYGADGTSIVSEMGTMKILEASDTSDDEKERDREN